ncbi:S-adenosylmethionine decarboxylase proenzyme [Nymphon striatum]|nr:S-adenosylmethionine decarboxylase proenzyme [Nymphon striatum]
MERDNHNHSSVDNFFEGTEKLLEVWFGRSDGNDDAGCDLRIIPRDSLDELLKNVHCNIISCKKNTSMDAYVLSESSMFVSKKRFILKTCGSTTLLYAIQPLIYLVTTITGFDEVQDLFYSRKNFMKPELQSDIHQDFSSEVKTLDSLFDNGTAHCLGSVNRDCWYLYTLTPAGYGIHDADQTIEISFFMLSAVMFLDCHIYVLMQDLDQDKMRIFSKEICSVGSEATRKSGIDKLLPDMIIDDVLFDPCGYSMNGILPNGHYITIHITPEPECSYVSFESNIPLECYYELVTKLLKTFNPKKFIITVFANELSIAASYHKNRNHMKYQDYQQLDFHFCRLNTYDLSYMLFAKAPS